MLRHVFGDRFEADVDDRIQIVAKSQSNDGVTDARFEYDRDTLPREVISGLPGCTFTVRDGRKQFQAVVMFAAGAGSSARYDLFEVDESGGLLDLGRSVTKDDGAALVGLAVEGVRARVAVGATRGVRAAAPEPAPPRRKAAKKKAARKPAKKTAKKKAAKETAKKRPAKQAKTKRASARRRIVTRR